MGELKSLRHLAGMTFTPNGVPELLERSSRAEKRELAQLLLNCPGSMIRRERDLIICVECSAPVWDRDIFLHKYLRCDSTDPILINKYYDRICLLYTSDAADE